MIYSIIRVHNLLWTLVIIIDIIHVAVLLMLSSLTYVSTPPDRLVHHWSRTPWDRLHHYFNSFHWDIPRSVDAVVSFVTAAIVLATQKLVPSRIP